MPLNWTYKTVLQIPCITLVNHAQVLLLNIPVCLGYAQFSSIKFLCTDNKNQVTETTFMSVYFPPYKSLESYGFSPQVSFRVQYPQDYLDLSHEDRKEFKHTRYGNDHLYGILLFFFFMSFY